MHIMPACSHFVSSTLLWFIPPVVVCALNPVSKGWKYWRARTFRSYNGSSVSPYWPVISMIVVKPNGRLLTKTGTKVSCTRCLHTKLIVTCLDPSNPISGPSAGRCDRILEYFDVRVYFVSVHTLASSDYCRVAFVFSFLLVAFDLIIFGGLPFLDN